MANIIAGVMIGILSIIILMALSPAIVNLTNPIKDSANFNCPGYISTSGTNTSYNSSLSGLTNTFGCGIIDIVVPLLIIGVIIAIVLIILYGDREQEQFVR